MPQESHEQHSTKTHLQIDRPIFASYWTHFHELFGVFGDFYASGTQDAKVTNSLGTHHC